MLCPFDPAYSGRPARPGPFRDADDVAVRIAAGSGSTPRLVLRRRGYLRACRGRLAVREVQVVNVEAQLDRASLGTRGRPEQSEVEVLTVRPRVLTVRLLV